MTATIEPYQFVTLKRISKQLINTYKTVSDDQTIAAIQMMTLDKMDQLFPVINDAVKHFSLQLMDKKMTFKQLEFALAEIKQIVMPFTQPSDQAIQGLFKKIKKLSLPDWEKLDLSEATYIGWQDSATQRKFLIAEIEGTLRGVSGVQSSKGIKNMCAICQQTEYVSLFLAKTKTAGDGTYTKKGNYICVDSMSCNQQIEQKVALNHFFEMTKGK